MSLTTLLALNLRCRGLDQEGSRAPGWRRERAYCVARDGRVVSFVAPELVEPMLGGCLGRWIEEAARRPGLPELARSVARFWLAFVAIHPFVDGNGRTAKAFLRSELERLGYRLLGFDLIDRYLIEGRPADFDRLTALFLVSIVPTGGMS
ncbi:MAG: Fic family protein [Elusimicrobia bacterium]|nr:Fic family protein [Elusimicrobiota bacterium]